MIKLNQVQQVLLADIHEEINYFENKCQELRRQAEEILAKQPVTMFLFRENEPSITEVDAIYVRNWDLPGEECEVYQIWHPFKREVREEFYSPSGDGIYLYKTRQELLDKLIPIYEQDQNDESLALATRFNCRKITDWLKSQVNET